MTLRLEMLNDKVILEVGESGTSDCLVYVSVLQTIRDMLKEESIED